MTRRARLRDKDFLAELKAYADAQRALIEAECEGFDPDPTARDIRASRARDDFRFFAKTYFPHYVKGEESVFHTWFYDNVPALVVQPGGALINLSAPRGEAKSTLGTQLLNLWLVITGRKWFIPIVMDAYDQAATMLEAIKVELADNPRLAMDFPDEAGVGRVWQAGVILTRGNRKVQAFGARKRMRGLRHGPHRPDHVSLDDIENDENVLSKEQRDKIESWVLKTVLNLGPPDGSMSLLYLNTILHHDSVANRFHKKPRWLRRKFRAIMQWPDRMDLWQEWERLFLDEQGSDALPGEEVLTIGAAQQFYDQHRAIMERGAVVSWPGTRPLLRLMQIRAESHHAFDCEYQNDPTNQDAAWFASLQFWVQPSREWVFYGAHDPSLGRLNKSRDPSACLVGGLDRKSGKLDVVEARIARIPPERQVANIIEFQREYSCLVWAFEAVQFQEFMRQHLVKESAAQKVPVPALPVQPHTDKDLRIQSLSPHVFNGLIRSHARHTVLNDQLRHYPEADHDDGPDALEMLWKVAIAGAGGVPRIRLGKRTR